MKDKTFELLYDALYGKSLPLVTLDNKWHQLFGPEFKSKKMSSIEKKLNKAIQQQGQLNCDLKEYRAAKNKLMKSILNNMEEVPVEDERSFFRKEKKMDTSQKFISDLNNKITQAEIRLLELPQEIINLNNQLIAEGVRLCYDTIKANQQQLDKLETWIESTRTELREKIIIKQEKEEQSQHIYSYIHDVLGAEVINELDLNYEVKTEE